MRQAITSSHLPSPAFRYSPIIKAGPFYQFSGMLGIDPATKKIVTGGPYAEARQILQTLSAALPELGLSLEQLLSATIYTTQFGEFPQINKAWEETFTKDIVPPARTSIGVAALPLGATVEIEFRFYKERA